MHPAFLLKLNESLRSDIGDTSLTEQHKKSLLAAQQLTKELN